MTLLTSVSRSQPPRRWRDAAWPAAAGLLLAIVTTALCRSAAGVSLGLFFGGIGFATLLVPPLVAGEPALRGRALVAAGVGIGTGALWLTALGELVTPGQWLACTLVIVAYALALLGVCSALLALRVHPVLAAGTVTLAGLLWLAWPVWLSPALRRPGGDALAAWLIPAHPLFAVNATLPHFDTWDRYPLAYGSLTALNQDVFYALPTGVHWAVLAHVLAGALALGSGWFIEPRRERRRVTAGRRGLV